jgi:hypothetical protein
MSRGLVIVLPEMALDECLRLMGKSSVLQSAGGLGDPSR